jgi:hypothetical protein|tara:strand:- start:2961 stop:3242 length:282 start_codon:yes stop_codon:yes gene_type:complete
MTKNLGEMIRDNGFGVYCGGIDEDAMPDDTLFGFENVDLLRLCHPSNNMARKGLQYLNLPSDFKKTIKNPNDSLFFKNGAPLFFLHYTVNKKD